MNEEDLSCPQCGHTDIHGYEIQGVYDGILLWKCPNCGHAWPRFDPPGRLYRMAMEIIAGWSKADLVHPE